MEFFEIYESDNGEQKLKLKELREMDELKHLTDEQVFELQERLHSVLDEVCQEKNEETHETKRISNVSGSKSV